jgi:hypothetical protein
MASLEQETASAADEIRRWFASTFNNLAEFSATVATAVTTQRGSRINLLERDLAPIKALSVSFLAANPVVGGAGMILAPGAVDAHRGTIDWWRHDEEGTDSKVLFNLATESGSSYDFQSLPWFNAVAETGQPAIAGPYVDYGGMDQYIVTLMVPLDLGEDILGMVGCDIEVSALEKLMVPILRKIHGDAALLSSENRVILGNSGRFLVGNRVRQSPVGGGIVEVGLLNLGLKLIHAEHASDSHASGS